MSRARYRRGEVWRVQFEPTIGSEIGKARPALIVSPSEMNGIVRTVIVVPFTTRSQPRAFRIPIAFGGRAGLALVDQTKSVSMGRLVRPLGIIEQDTLDAVLAILREAFAV